MTFDRVGGHGIEFGFLIIFVDGCSGHFEYVSGI
jgi:hypothetical protein